MPGKDSNDYRLYVEARLRAEDEKHLALTTQVTALTTSINAQFIALNDRVDVINRTLHEIKTQTTLTNGRVNDLEEFQEDTEKVIEERSEKCPNLGKINEALSKINKLEGSLGDIMFFARKPKLFIAIIAFVVIAAIASTLIYYNSLRNSLNELHQQLSNVELVK
jgi:hypothetical protein